MAKTFNSRLGADGNKAEKGTDDDRVPSVIEMLNDIIDRANDNPRNFPIKLDKVYKENKED
jgi:hypothetical protein